MSITRTKGLGFGSGTDRIYQIRRYHVCGFGKGPSVGLRDISVRPFALFKLGKGFNLLLLWHVPPGVSSGQIRQAAEFSCQSDYSETFVMR